MREFDVLHKAIASSVTIEELNAAGRISFMVQMAGHLISTEIERLESAFNERYITLTK